MVYNPDAFVSFKLEVTSSQVIGLTDEANRVPLIQAIDGTVTEPTLDRVLRTPSATGSYGGLVDYYFSIGGESCYVLRMPTPVRASLANYWGLTSDEKHKLQREAKEKTNTAVESGKVAPKEATSYLDKVYKQAKKDLLEEKRQAYHEAVKNGDLKKYEEEDTLRIVTPVEIISLTDDDFVFLNQRVMHHIPVRAYNGNYLGTSFCGTNYFIVENYAEAIDDVTNDMVHNPSIRLYEWADLLEDNNDLIDVFVVMMRGFSDRLYDRIVGPANFNTTSDVLSVSLTPESITAAQLSELRARGIIVTGQDFRTNQVSFQSFGLAKVFHGMGFLRANFIRIEAINEILINVWPDLQIGLTEAEYDDATSQLRFAIISVIDRYLVGEGSQRAWVRDGTVRVTFPPYSTTLQQTLLAGEFPAATIELSMDKEPTNVTGSFQVS